MISHIYEYRWCCTVTNITVFVIIIIIINSLNDKTWAQFDGQLCIDIASWFLLCQNLGTVQYICNLMLLHGRKPQCIVKLMHLYSKSTSLDWLYWIKDTRAQVKMYQVLPAWCLWLGYYLRCLQQVLHQHWCLANCYWNFVQWWKNQIVYMCISIHLSDFTRNYWYFRYQTFSIS